MPTEMSMKVVSGRVRLGILALPVYGIVALASGLIRPIGPESLTNVRANAEYYASSRLMVFDFMIVVLAGLLIFASFALYAYLASGRAERWAFYAMVLSVAALVPLGAIGGQDSVLAPLARQYLDGQQAVWEQTWDLLNDPGGGFTLADLSSGYFIVAQAVLYPLGHLLFGIAIWRSQTLPQGAAILWFAYLLLFFAVALTPWAAHISNLLSTVAGGWIAWTVWRQPDKMAGAEAQPRVR